MFEKDLKVYLDLLPICLTLTSMISFHTLVWQLYYYVHVKFITSTQQSLTKQKPFHKSCCWKPSVAGFILENTEMESCRTRIDLTAKWKKDCVN